MLIGYFDEVKYQVGVQPYEWLAGIFVEDATLPAVEARLNEIAAEAFGTVALEKATELHAAPILNGKGRWKGQPLEKRIAILRALADLLGERDLIMRVQVRIEVAKLYSKLPPPELAFMFFVEKANQLFIEKNSIGLLIGDFEHEGVVDRVTRKLSDYRAHGTPYEFGKDVDRIVDTVHFCRSHHSRLLQLADAYAWFSQLPHGASARKEPQQSLIAYATEHAGIMWPTKYKHWPPT